jgi:hypothetical protein
MCLLNDLRTFVSSFHFISPTVQSVKWNETNFHATITRTRTRPERAKDANAALQEAQRDPEPDVRRGAGIALSCIGPQQAPAAEQHAR